MNQSKAKKAGADLRLIQIVSETVRSLVCPHIPIEKFEAVRSQRRQLGLDDWSLEMSLGYRVARLVADEMSAAAQLELPETEARSDYQSLPEAIPCNNCGFRFVPTDHPRLCKNCCGG